jgi:hypothetical protein
MSIDRIHEQVAFAQQQWWAHQTFHDLSYTHWSINGEGLGHVHSRLHPHYHYQW